MIQGVSLVSDRHCLLGMRALARERPASASVSIRNGLRREPSGSRTLRV